jgi:hypothetical protein
LVSQTGIEDQWLMTYVISNPDFEQGFLKELIAYTRVKLNVSDVNKYVGVISLTDTSVALVVSNNSELIIMNILNQTKFDLNSDGYYDILIELESINLTRAKFLMKSIYEDINVNNSDSFINNSISMTNVNQTNFSGLDKPLSNINLDKSGILFWVILAIIFILICIVLVVFFIARNQRIKEAKSNQLY